LIWLKKRKILSRLGDTKVVDEPGVNPYQLVCIFIPQGVLLVPPLDYQPETCLFLWLFLILTGLVNAQSIRQPAGHVRFAIGGEMLLRGIQRI
jgi:hypothetical protein